MSGLTASEFSVKSVYHPASKELRDMQRSSVESHQCVHMLFIRALDGWHLSLCMF